MKTVLVAAGAIGFILGMGRHADWQDAVEPAQVLAGLVQYPAGNPVREYSLRAWTVVHQALAALLYLGAQERALSLVISGVLGMLSFQALGLVVFAISRDIVLSSLSPFLIYLVGGTNGGVTYPVMLMGTMFTYGVLGLSYALLTLAMFGAGRERAGAVLLGFGPAIHASLGVLTIPVAAIALAADPPGRLLARRALPFFAAGAAGALLSAAVHAMTTGAFYTPAAAGADRYLAAFVRYWDSHRGPFAIFSLEVGVVLLTTIIAALWLGPFRRAVPEHGEVLLRSLVISAVLGAVLSLAYWLPPESVPSLLLQLMPSRLMNLSVMSCMALTVAVVSRYRQQPVIRALRGAVVVASAGILIAVLIGTASDVLRYGFPLPEAVDPALRAAAGRAGGPILTAANLHHVQLHTRRPVVLDGGAIDAVTYTTGAAAETARILQRLYGVDLLSPGPEVAAARPGALLEDTGKALWESRPPAAWRAIREEFGSFDVLTPESWTLQLPVVARGDDLVLYEIR